MRQLVDVLSKDSRLSLRVIDYLCTNYAKKHDVMYYIDRTPFNLFLQYRGQLKAYSKMQFDPFRRHERIFINVPQNILPGGKLETTVAQLNFFKWAIDHKVLDYLSGAVIETVEKSMNTMCKKTKTASSIPTPKITTSAKRHHINVTVTFK